MYATTAEDLSQISESYNDRLDSKFNRFCELLVIKANSAAMHGLREATIKTSHLNLTHFAIVSKLNNRFMFEDCVKTSNVNSHGTCTSLTIAW
jgi:hypothetical protein